MPFKQTPEKTVLVYEDGITIMVSGSYLVEKVDTILKWNISGKSVGSQLGTRGIPSMPSDRVIGRGTDRSVELFGVRFGQNFQVDKNWNAKTKWIDSKLSLKRWLEVANANNAFGAIKYPGVLPFPRYRSIRQDHLLLIFL